MSVIFGYTQLLRRRVRRGHAVGDEELLRVLGLMEQALRTMIGELTQVSRQAGTNDDDPNPNH
jgi:hypothetical protein